MTNQKQARRKPTRTASHTQPQNPAPWSAENKQGPIRVEHGRHFTPGRRIGPLFLPGLAGVFAWSDSSLLKFLAHFIADNSPVDGPDNLDTPGARALAEAMIIARTVDKLRGAAEGYAFPLPGLAAHRTLTIGATLEYLANLWHDHQ